MIDENLKNAKILIVDDQKANIAVLEGFLEMQGYDNVVSVTDPRDVLQLYATFEPDLILLDLMMPYLSGFEVMEQLKPLIPTDSFLPILVLTADATADAKQKALSGGASDFLTKPFDLTEVGLRIKNLLYTRYLIDQLNNQNQILDLKVKERTTELEKMNKELLIAKDKAEASDRLKTAFMQNISHEVRTPLNGILGFGALLADPFLDAEDKQAFIPMLEFSSNRLIKTITDYMDISLIVSENMEVNRRKVKLNSELKALKTLYQPMCSSKSVDFYFKIDEAQNDFDIETDPEFLRKMLSHLLDNAVTFTNQGSIAVSHTIKSDEIEFIVRDTGTGIAADALERVFESFMQEDVSTTRGHEGSGLGLSIVKGLLQLLGGKIKLESTKGEGTTVSFSIPTGQKKNEVIVSEEKSKVVAIKESPVILVVEDEQSNRFFIQVILKKHGFKVLVAENGKEAVDMCHKHPEISLVLMDLKMPVMSGYEATPEIKSFRKDIVIIAITAYAMSGDERKAFQSGCDDFIPKPVNVQSLMDKLEKFGYVTSEKIV
jgi:two-component system, sensor histidine kinase and response regulator